MNETVLWTSAQTTGDWDRCLMVEVVAFGKQTRGSVTTDMTGINCENLVQ